MKTWIHFTEDVEGFIEDLKSIEDDDPASFAAEGLFVYKWRDGFPEAEKSIEWGGRTGILINCEEKYVELIQEDPIGDNPDNDEYMILIENFKHCKILS